MTKILVCTVGGSHQPIVTAIQQLKPDHVCFVCSGRDPETGRPGSDTQVLGEGAVIKAKPTDERPTLPNLPNQLGLPATAYRVVIVPTDELDGVYSACVQAFDSLRSAFPDARLIADYTGGTKTMTAGLTVAALDAGVELSLVTGNRGDLIRVHDGSEFASPANVEAVRLRRDMTNCLSAWQQHGYGEAEAALSALGVPRDAANRSALFRARELSHAYALWDRFDHAGALEILQRYAATLQPDERASIGVLQRLCDRRNPPKRTPALLLDLYRNAQRRATQGRYDDAVARAYRLIEWTAQWILQRDCGLDTSDIPSDFDAGGVQLTTNQDGRRQAALMSAWTLVQTKTDGAAAAFFAAERSRLLDHLKTRNQSILAHGYTPIPEPAWHSFAAWLEVRLVPVILQEARTAGLREIPTQLPTCYHAAQKRG